MCLRPIPIRYTNYFGKEESVSVPCGKCIQCVVKDQNSWKCRIVEESKSWKHLYFFTLTYSDKNLPFFDYSSGSKKFGRGVYANTFSTACKKDIQDWLKRFRVNYVRRKAKSLGVSSSDIRSDSSLWNKYKPRLSYFICSEYGPNGTHRPHYHGVIMTDICLNDMSLLFSDWSKRFGYVDYSEVVDSSSAPANYVSKYCCKGEFSSRTEDVENGLIEKAWRICSKSLGIGYVSKYKDYHIPYKRFAFSSSRPYVDVVLERMFYFDGKYRYSLPRYYKSKLFYEKRKFVRRKYDVKIRKVVPEIIFREVPTSFLWLEIKAALLRKSDAAFSQRVAEARISCPDASDTQIYSEVSAFELRNNEDIGFSLRSKLDGFYTSNSRKYKNL